MGSKKGKGRQRCGLHSKSARAAQAWELKDRISETKLWLLEYKFNPRKHHKDDAAAAACQNNSIPDDNHNNNNNNRSSILSNTDSRRVLLQGHVRGILRERLWTDRWEEMQDRRRRNVQVRNNRNVIRTSRTAERIEDKSNDFLKMNRYGNYSFSESPIFEKSKYSSVPSLQMMAAKVIGQYGILQMCLKEYGLEKVYDYLMKSLNPSVISYLSLNCVLENCNQNEMAYLLGRHSTLQLLCLNLGNTITMNHNEFQNDENYNSYKQDAFVDSSLLDLAQSRSESPRGDELVSWEDIDYDYLDYHHEFNTENENRCCSRINAFILSNGINISSTAVIEFLKKCPSIRYLALNNCLNEKSGPEFLLDSFYRGRMIGCLLCEDIKVIDFSFCGWLTDEVLLSFIQEEVDPDIVKRRVQRFGDNGKLIIYAINCWQLSVPFCKDSLIHREGFDDHQSWLSIIDDKEAWNHERECLHKTIMFSS